MDQKRKVEGGEPLLILGIDTSCDDTSCAIVEDGRKVFSNIVSSQVDIHSRYGGVVPEIASRKHLENIVPSVRAALGEATKELSQIDAVAVTFGPGLLGALFVGLSFAKALSYSLNIPLVGVHHLEGHIFANFLEDNDPSFPMLNLVVSGGHSDLILMRDFGDYEIIGETRDDAAGEVFDKVAREMNLPFPGGPHLDKIAEQGDPQKYRFTKPKLKGRQWDFSFSGTKTRALQIWDKVKKDPSCIPDIAASFRYSVVRDLTYPIPHLLKDTGAKSFGVSGGVAANILLRDVCHKIAEKCSVPFYVPDREYCTDNGAMIASAGAFRLSEGLISPYDLDARSSLDLKSWGSKIEA